MNCIFVRLINIPFRFLPIKESKIFLQSKPIQQDLRVEMRLRTEDGVNRIHGDLVFGGITNQPLRVGEGHVRRSRPVTLIISDDLDTIVLPYSHARVGRAQIDSDRWTFSFTTRHYHKEKFSVKI